MIRQQAYRIWLKLVVLHEYFDSQQCGLDLEPNAETNRMLQKAGILFKQQNSCSWILVAEDEINLEPDSELCFRLKVKQPDFYYYTDQKTRAGAGCSLTDYNREGTWKVLHVPVTEQRLSAKEPETIELSLKSKVKHVEFLVFPSGSYTADPLEIREQRGKIAFSKPESVNLPGTEKALYRFVTTKTVPLKQKTDYQFHLWELKKSGENLLSKLPDFPLVAAVSPFSPTDTITSYIYL